MSRRPRRPLPDLCVIALLKMMPLADRLKAGNLSPRWSILLRAANRQVHSLAIFSEKSDYQQQLQQQAYISPFSINSDSPSVRMITGTNEDGKRLLYPATRLTKWNCLVIGKSWWTANPRSPYSVEWKFTHAFSALTELIFVTRRLKDYQPFLVALLEHPTWRQQLIGFSLQDYYKSWDTSESAAAALSPKVNRRLWAAINGLSSLRFLAIEWSGGLKMTEADLSVIAQLQVLSAQCFNDSFAALMPSLKRYAPAAAAAENQKADLQVILNSNRPGKIAELSDPVRDRISCFTRTTCSYLDEDLICSLNRFRNLATFALLSHPSSAQKDFTYLSRLQQRLVHFNWKIDFSSYRYLNADFQSPEAVLNSVKALDLHLTIGRHSEVQWLNLSRTLPNVQVIYVASFSCENCGTVNCDLKYAKKKNSKKNEQAFQCLREVLPQLHRGLPLRQIVLDWPNYQNAEQVCSVGE